jgi:ribosomal RNA-processing protein 9
MSSFFTIPSGEKKRKRSSAVEPPKKRFASSKPSKPSKDPKPPRKPQRDESISGSEDESAGEAEEPFFDEGAESSSSDEEGGDAEETAAERRLRLAERYLENIREEVDEVGFDAEEIDRDLIAERLKEDGAESKGRMYRKLASTLSFEEAEYSLFKNNSESVTSVATCPPFAYTVSKDMYLAKWKIQDLPKDQWKDPHPLSKKKKKPPPPPKRKPELVKTVKGDKKKSKDNTYLGHVDSILTIACSQDGKFVVTGGRDRRIVVWDADLKPLRVFSQHRDAVTGLAFRRGTNQMYSSSADRTIKIWSLDELAYVETLFGHQDSVVDVAALAQERCISVGARDRTARLWKVVEETQLVFRGGGGSKKSSRTTAQEGSMDRIAMIDEELFVTGGDNGNLSLWTMHKKKPVFTLPLAHGLDPPLPLEEVSAEAHPDPAVIPQPQPRWITALATIPYSDVILSGSWDGFVRVWRVSDDKKKIEAVGVISTSTFTASSILSEPPVLNLNGYPAAQVNGLSNNEEEPKAIVRGVINDISIFERGDRGKDGVCVVVATGKELRMGRWKKITGGRNGAVVFEISKVLKSNGVVHEEGDDDE